MSKRKLITISTVGFALFAMFFGAGNLILPPFIGINSGDYWWAALLGFFITAILCPFLGILMIAQTGTSLSDVKKKIHPKVISFLNFFIILCIGPLIAIPRTAATTYEVGILPLFNDIDKVWFSIGFFLITFCLSISQTKIVDIIGKILTPLLLLSLFALILLGILSPTKSIETTDLDFSKSFFLGFSEGYQTLDVLASVIFAGLIINTVIDSGYTNPKERTEITIGAGILSTLSLLFIYGGLIYLGATSDYTITNEISRTDLLLHISRSILGEAGSAVISLTISLACITTAIALTSAVGNFFEEITNKKISYKWVVIICLIISTILSIKNVDEIINYAINILLFIYPITFALILLVLFFGRKVNYRLPYLVSILITAFLSSISILENLNLKINILSDFKKNLPLQEYSVEWLIPSFLGFGITYLFIKLFK